MNAIARLQMRADLDAIGAAIAVLEAGAHASRDLDAMIFEALGWWVERAAPMAHRSPWTMRSAHARDELPLPRATKRIDCARQVVPFGWDWGTGERGGQGYAWCNNRKPHLVGQDRLNPLCRWFEARAKTPALALVKCALYGQRSLMLDQVTAPARLRCDCGWEGHERALRAHAESTFRFCPDCDRVALAAEGEPA